jgi:hypothetical protein
MLAMSSEKMSWIPTGIVNFEPFNLDQLTCEHIATELQAREVERVQSFCYQALSGNIAAYCAASADIGAEVTYEEEPFVYLNDVFPLRQAFVNMFDEPTGKKSLKAAPPVINPGYQHASK